MRERGRAPGGQKERRQLGAVEDLDRDKRQQAAGAAEIRNASMPSRRRPLVRVTALADAVEVDRLGKHGGQRRRRRRQEDVGRDHGQPEASHSAGRRRAG